MTITLSQPGKLNIRNMEKGGMKGASRGQRFFKERA
jgi:hypothetical protein